MKKRAIAVFSGFIVVLAALFFLIKKEPPKADKVLGTELFTDELTESVIQIDFRKIDESGIISIKDKEKINEFFNILKNEEYQTLNQWNQKEGFYSFDFVTKDGTENIGIGGDGIVFGEQYKTISGNDLVKGVIKETVFSEQ